MTPPRRGFLNSRQSVTGDTATDVIPMPIHTIGRSGRSTARTQRRLLRAATRGGAEQSENAFILRCLLSAVHRPGWYLRAADTDHGRHRDGVAAITDGSYALLSARVATALSTSRVRLMCWASGSLLIGRSLWLVP
jgi:hypothetical protein